MAERPPLDAVLFDAGGTLVRLDFEWMAETLTGLGVPATAETLQRAEVAGRRRYDTLRAPGPRAGAAAHQPSPLGHGGDTHGYFAAMVEGAGGGPRVVDAALELFFERHRLTGLWTRPMEGARATLDALAAMPLALAAVSNSDGRAESHLRDCGVLDGLAFVVDSHRVGVEKPDPRIFAIALERLGLAPERTLFIGDILSVDRTGARGAGIHFVLIDPYGDYAPPEVPAIASIAGLPDFIRGRFTLAATDGAPGAASPRETPGGRT
jgi:putative hydrolase of the HAD superfamily